MSDQRTSGSGGGYIEQRHLPQEGIDYDPVVDGARNLLPLMAQEGMVAMPTSYKRAWSPVRSSEHHIDLTGPSAGAADSS